MKLTMNRVHERVTIKEGNEKLNLTVDGDPMRMVAGLSQTQKMLKAINGESTEQDTKNAALFFAQVLFGQEQSQKLMEFYMGDAGCVIGICGKVFQQISGQITKLQKRKG